MTARPDPLLVIEELTVSYRSRRGNVDAVRGAGLTLHRGETLALVGESGSGKSTTAHAVVGLLPESARIGAGRLVFDGTDLHRASQRTLRGLRGLDIGLIPQDPTVSLNPVQRIGDQVAEVFTIHGLADRKGARAAAIEALERAGLSPDRARQYPHELSGGMRQRVLIAIALAARPKLVVADEPTSALDVTVQRRILDHIAELTEAAGSAVLLITHDLGIAAERADRVAVMSQGRVVEVGTAEQILNAPQDEYTKSLIAAAPSLGAARSTILARVGGASPRSVAGEPPVAAARPASIPPEPHLVATDLVKDFPLAGGTIRAVDHVSLTVRRGQTLALVGESGSGKSTTARLLLRLVEPTSGRIEFDGEDITDVRGGAARALRRRMQVVYQNPYASLNPRLTVEQVITDPLSAFGIGDRDERRRRAADLVERVALPSSVLRRKPAELSGGQRQRVAIARALSLAPELVVCDEPVSALDVSVQAQILELLVQLQHDLGVSYLFISHDLAVVREIAHDVGVMRDGRLVELGSTDSIFDHASHAYTQELLTAIPHRRVG
jgi:peptide/nickel transport system ATP-binding protein